jgi:hypothetical protein
VVLHLAEVRAARDSGEVAKENEEQRTAGERRKADGSTVRT